jgi:hypothetical protein
MLQLFVREKKLAETAICHKYCGTQQYVRESTARVGTRALLL